MHSNSDTHTQQYTWLLNIKNTFFSSRFGSVNFGKRRINQQMLSVEKRGRKISTQSWTCKKWLFQSDFSLKMVRKLKFHEQKLLRKVNFVNWEVIFLQNFIEPIIRLFCCQVSNNLHEVKIMRRYCIQKREDYTLYNKLSREIRYIQEYLLNT